MSAPYYEDDLVTLYHGDCREVTEWLEADVLVTDPPYGRAWKQGDTGSRRGWASDSHAGIRNDESLEIRDHVLAAWGKKPAFMFGDLMIAPPASVRHVLIFDKGTQAGFTGAIGGYRRNAEAVYVIGAHPSGLGGRSAILTSGMAGTNLARTTGHPHTKPVDLLGRLIQHGPPGAISDPLAGSGSTLLAAKLVGRRAVGVELEERYCEIAARRLAQDTLFGGAA